MIVCFIFKNHYIILIVLNVIYNDLKCYLKKLTSTKCKYNTIMNRYELNFYLENDKYCLIFPKKKNKELETNSFLVMDENNINITKKFKKYYGPCNNFFGQDLTPKDLNHTFLKIWINKTFYKFNNDEKINFASLS